MKREKSELLNTSRKNLEWFNENYKSLRKEYDNQWVAIQENKVVASGSTYDQIVDNLKKEDKKSVVIEYIDSKQLAMFF